MECVMLWWDELDDLTAALAHLARSAFAEVTALPRLPEWGSLIGQWLRLPA